MPCVLLCAFLALGLLLLCLAVNLLLCGANGCPGVMLYVWLPKTAAAFHSQVYLPFVALRCYRLQNFYHFCPTYKRTLSGEKHALIHPFNTNTLISTYVLTQTHTYQRTNTQLL
ncbi:hypothetical protein AMECASPLE_007528 [Ameca splendens]|uniref:Secreted protein n=1 Tax=Ameca splendens TaxID=208324 RepID=A0ABV0Z965_9TELE